jgi:hypothetical protein
MTGTETATAPGRRLEWQVAEVSEIVIETPRVKSLFLHVAGWQSHLPGQHVDIKLTAEDGYQAQRSYSIASAPENELLTLTVERVAGFPLISSTNSAPVIDSSCGGPSEAILFGLLLREAHCISSRVDRELRRSWQCFVTARNER